ncbi:hypothetical protein [Shinella zoogloeoides]|uniref:hypothetical protein n=1 Tax=Shinella zoogloeoides TaxID=352475 RepID=UPI00299E9D8D|nr:hypothetical protein [Shinella zoogloeoides]WPE19877.1 hypothetical protein ShzoTeo12_10530 [Shinella zoogloeoides]
MGQTVCQIRQARTSPEDAYERAFTLCEAAVKLERNTKVYIGEALNSLKRRGNFGSWLHKLYHRKKVTIHLHYYERLVQILEELSVQNQEQIGEIEKLIQNARGRINASVQSGMESHSVSVGRPQ